MFQNQLPTEEKNGSFNGRETRFGPCDCGNPACKRPTSYYVDTGEWCREQSLELRGADTGRPGESSGINPQEALLQVILAAMRGDEEAIAVLRMMAQNSDEDDDTPQRPSPSYLN